MLEMPIRTGRRLQDAARQLREGVARRTGERQQVNSLHRQRMTCSGSLAEGVLQGRDPLGRGLGPPGRSDDPLRCHSSFRRRGNRHDLQEHRPAERQNRRHDRQQRGAAAGTGTECRGRQRVHGSGQIRPDFRVRSADDPPYRAAGSRGCDGRARKREHGLDDGQRRRIRQAGDAEP